MSNFAGVCEENLGAEETWAFSATFLVDEAAIRGQELAKNE
jgi:hypothetical protein